MFASHQEAILASKHKYIYIYIDIHKQIKKVQRTENEIDKIYLKTYHQVNHHENKGRLPKIVKYLPILKTNAFKYAYIV